LSELIHKEMCEGCGNVRGGICIAIRDPKWIFKHRNGKCFAKVTPERAKEIEDEIRARKNKEGTE
jgi:hypothetical protein